jgi:hypothetical protein
MGGESPPDQLVALMRTTMKKSDIINTKKPVPKKVEGKKIDPIDALKKAYAKPQKVAEIGGRGYV